MGQISKQQPVKLIVGFIFADELIIAKTISILERKFGRIDFESQVLAFKYTDYYEKEFGRNLNRKFVSFEKLIPPENLPEIKTFTNKIENKFLTGVLRKINIDPGYLSLSKLVLASTKNFSHRIYLDRGIFAELTLFFKDKTFQSLDWTYPDYRTSEYFKIFNEIRNIFAEQIRR